MLIPAIGGFATSVSAEFAPVELFASGEAGGWYDPSDLSTVWQDDAGTVSGAVDSPVGRLDDKSGNGNSVTQVTSGARPILRSDGSLYWLESDGVDDHLNFSSNPLTGAATATAVHAAKRKDMPPADGSESGPVLGEFGTDSLSEHEPLNSSADLYSGFGSDSRGHFGSMSAAGTNPYILTHKRSTTSLDVDLNRVSLGSHSSAVAWRSSSRLLKSFSVCYTDRFYGCVLVGRELTTAEIADTEDYLASKSGATL